MISGIFRDGHPWIKLDLHGLSGNIAIDFIVDTGFNGEIALPQHLIERLTADPAGHRSHALADGSRQVLAVYDVSVDWLDNDRVTEAIVLNGEPLIGTILLNNLALEIEVIEGGSVGISEL